MRSKSAIVLFVVAGLAACGGGRQDGIVQFHSLTPNTSKQKEKDARKVTTACPGCKKALGPDVERCDEQKKCGVRINWAKEYPCAYCQGSKVCRACVLMEQKSDGKCYACKGEGILPYQGKTPECKNCGGKGKCPICEGTTKCDFCKGEGTVSRERVSELSKASRAASSTEEGGAKPEKEAKPEEKKEEAPKPEENKPEEKKDN